ncbi:hypothetical protein [Pilimelia columellifera]|uniref:Anthranilate phosphoribosyltransferase n=1 Tax=Pilimelia columellifera subsp. columellifera TaxID=706583 RepID=A0ABN3N603_9ACTN
MFVTPKALSARPNPRRLQSPEGATVLRFAAPPSQQRKHHPADPVPARCADVPAGSWSAAVLHALLRDRSDAADVRWRRWCVKLLRSDRLGPEQLHDWWTVVTEFDPVLAGYAANPVPVPDGTVVVAGSGKEQFKTFNVSTAAAVLAAAAGVPVVKGISRSVSAVSGATDILEALGIRPVTGPAAVAQVLDRYGIAFVAYPQFCPRYAARYDGVFDTLNPASFFMPVATMCVRARSFVLGLAHHEVTLAAAALRRIRPDLATGIVVSTELSPGETVDEYGDVGALRVARQVAGVITSDLSQGAPPTESWRRAVAHRSTHDANAALVAQALTDGADTPATRLVEVNAALILEASGASGNAREAVGRVRDARRSGHAMRLLTTLTNNR